MEEAEHKANYVKPEPQPEMPSHKDMRETMSWLKASEKEYAKRRW
jgi:hypothetical protein